MNTRDSLLESIDLECFLDHIAPGEWERFIDKEMAFDFFTRDMTPQELKKELDESECRNEPEPWPAFEGLKKAVNDLVDANDRLLGEVGDLRHENYLANDRIAKLEERIEKLLASKFAASSPKLIAKIITLANSEAEK